MTVTLQTMAGERLAEWLDRSRAHYIESRRAAGETLEQAEANAAKTDGLYFRDGQPVEGQHVYTVHAPDGRDVGELWIGVIDAASRGWWVFDVEIVEAERGHGFGRAAMQLAEAEAARLGAATLGLNVFGFNTVARGLYESLGYETTAVQMRKPVG